MLLCRNRSVIDASFNIYKTQNLKYAVQSAQLSMRQDGSVGQVDRGREQIFYLTILKMNIDNICYLQGNPAGYGRPPFCHETRVQENSEVHNQNSFQWKQVQNAIDIYRTFSKRTWSGSDGEQYPLLFNQLNQVNGKDPCYQKLLDEGYKIEKSGEKGSMEQLNMNEISQNALQ